MLRIKTDVDKNCLQDTIIEFDNIHELSESISLSCKISCIIKPSKLWVSSTLKNMDLLMKC